MKAGMIKLACTCGGIMFKGTAAGFSLSPLGAAALATLVASASYAVTKRPELFGPAKALVVSKRR